MAGQVTSPSGFFAANISARAALTPGLSSATKNSSIDGRPVVSAMPQPNEDDMNRPPRPGGICLPSCICEDGVFLSWRNLADVPFSMYLSLQCASGAQGDANAAVFWSCPKTENDAVLTSLASPLSVNVFPKVDAFAFTSWIYRHRRSLHMAVVILLSLWYHRCIPPSTDARQTTRVLGGGQLFPRAKYAPPQYTWF